VKWLPDGQRATLVEALEAVAPEVAAGQVVVSADTAGTSGDPRFWSSTAVAGGRFVVKFAWSRPAGLRLQREIALLTALARDGLVPFLPEVVAASTDPLLLVTRRVPGTSLFAVADSIGPSGRARAGRQLAEFLAALHSPAARERAAAAAGALPDPLFPATTGTLRDRLGRWIEPGSWPAVQRWCDWADEVLAVPAVPVLVHGDLHGDNQVWQRDRLAVVVDFETAGLADPEYDLRAFPGPGLGPDLELLTATVRHYERLTGRPPAMDRIMAWHLRGALGDVLWRSEAGLPLPDHRTPADWVGDLAWRFRELRLDVGGE
jgi:aminoglycoside phosphotransferase (APT) family kinase protein